MCYVSESRTPTFPPGDVHWPPPGIIASCRWTSTIANPVRHRFTDGLTGLGPCSTVTATRGSPAGRHRLSSLPGAGVEFLPTWKRRSRRAGCLMPAGFSTSAVATAILRRGSPGMARKVWGLTSRPPRSQERGPVTPTSPARCGLKRSTSATTRRREAHSTSSSTADACTGSPARSTPVTWPMSGLQAAKAPGCCFSCGSGEVGDHLRDSSSLAASNCGSIVAVWPRCFTGASRSTE